MRIAIIFAMGLLVGCTDYVEVDQATIYAAQHCIDVGTTAYGNLVDGPGAFTITRVTCRLEIPVNRAVSEEE